MKTLRSLFALCAFAVLTLASARADYLELEQDYYDTTSTESQQTLDASYHVFGYNSGDNYSLVLDYFFQTLDIESVEFEAWYQDDENYYYESDSAYGGAIEAGEDFSWLDLGLTLPSETPGTITVVVTFFFADSTYLTEWLSARIE